MNKLLQSDSTKKLKKPKKKPAHAQIICMKNYLKVFKVLKVLKFKMSNNNSTIVVLYTSLVLSTQCILYRNYANSNYMALAINFMTVLRLHLTNTLRAKINNRYLHTL